MSLILDPERETDLRPNVLEGSLDADGARLNLPYADSKFHVIRRTSQAEASFLAGLFGASSETSYASIIHEVRRYNRINQNGKDINFGVAIRLIAMTSTINLNMDLTIPNLAAAGQLKNIDAMAAINVVGYNASVGDLLVEPNDLDVESFMEFSKSFSNLHKHIFKTESERYYVPMPIEFID